MEVTFVKDTTTDDLHPHHDALPALVMKMPLDPNEIGPWLEVGLRMTLDLKNNIITCITLKRVILTSCLLKLSLVTTM